jgi:two-component system, chemotaxis family, protein-glutamate methylesterase/glutaminase
MARHKTTMGHDVVVIGASAGGLAPLNTVLAELPSNLAAALFVVIHRSAEAPNLLVKVLQRATRLRVVEAEDGAPIELGVVYVAPTGQHMLVEPAAVRIARGPKENRHRPAIDPLFRSAAWAFGPRVIGLLLSGLRSDGSAGLWAIKSCGGIAVVQDPSDAEYAAMPSSALESVGVDYCLKVSEMGARLLSLIDSPAESARAFPVPEQVKLETQMAQFRSNDVRSMNRIGTLSPFTCPECHGTLWEIDDQHVLRYRCHTGHGFSADALRSSIDDTTERALFSAMRGMEEGATMARRLAERARDLGHHVAAKSFDARAEAADQHAEALRKLLATAREAAD